MVWLAILLAVEWLPISATVHSTRGGASFARFFVAFVAFFAILGYSRVRESLPQISADLDSKRISPAYLLAHTAALLLFLILSFAPSFQDLFPLLSAVLWFASGLGSIALAALTFIPPGTAWRLISLAGRSVAYALVAAAAAWSLVPVCWSLWNTSRGRALTHMTFDFVLLILRNVLPNVSGDPANLVISTPGFALEIGDACSGFEGLGMMLVFGILWLWFFRREIRFPRALVLVPAGLVLMWVLNAVRIVLLIAIGDFGAPEIAMGGFHSQAGWISFSGVTLAYAASLQRFRWFARTVDRPAVSENRAAVFLLPLLAILAASLLAHAASANFEWLYPLRFVAACWALWFFRGSYKDIDWSFSWTGPVVGIAVFIVWIALERLLLPSAGAAMPVALASASAGTRTAWILIRALAACTTVPIAEELAFRGFLLRRLVAENFEGVPYERFTWLALLGSSLVFGALHGSRWIAGSLAGILYGLAAARRGKLGDAVAAHAVTNAILAAYVLAFDQWQLW